MAKPGLTLIMMQKDVSGDETWRRTDTHQAITGVQGGIEGVVTLNCSRKPVIVLTQQR